MTAGIEITVSQAMGVPPNPASVLTAIADDMMERRRSKAEIFVGALVENVGEDALLAAIERDPERDALLWTAIQAVMASGLEQKRIVLARVLSNAMTSDEPIDEAQLIVAALQELDGPHIRALARLKIADDADQAARNVTDEHMAAALAREPMPVLAGLVRAGVVYQGSVERESGLYSIPDPRTYGIVGVNEFGRNLLADLTR